MIKVEIFYIALGFFIGLFIVYVTAPVPKIILKYPTIDNIQNTTFIDDSGQCYRYYAQEVGCNNYPNAVNNKTEAEPTAVTSPNNPSFLGNILNLH